MKVNAIALARKFKTQFEKLKQQRQFTRIAELISCSLQLIPSEYNRQIFGYIPGIFRQIEIDALQIQSSDIFIGEPVVYKIFYPAKQELYGISYFYVFCYFKENPSQLNVYFQSAHPGYEKLSIDEYDLNQSKISFEGSVSAFSPDNISVISVSDPGHFVPGFTSSYYVGSAELNFNQLVAKVLENICSLADIKLNNTMLFGSSAGTLGALLTSTYLTQKTNVLTVNSQINIHYRNKLMEKFLGISQPKKLLEKFGDRVSCIHRFQQDICSVPNIYILANVNDNLYQRNFKFYQLYLSRYTGKGINNQSVFDSYYGVEGHGRPEPNSLKRKIKIAREILTMNSTLQPFSVE